MDETLPVIEGLRLIARTDESGPGEVWRARVAGGLGGAAGKRLPAELAGVGECDVRLLRLPVDEAIRARAHCVAGALVGLEDAGIVGVREVRTAYDGVALVLTPLASPMLALHLLARRRQLTAGEVVTLGVALGWALAAAHAAGITHGRLRDADVLIDPGGRPLLAGVGVMGVLGAAGEPGDDVRALSRMLLSLLDADSCGASKVAQALSQPPTDASELAAILAAAAAAAPIRLALDERLADEGQPPAPAHFRRRGSRRRRSSLGGLVAGLSGGLRGRLGADVIRRVPWRRVTRLAGAGGVIVVLAAVIGWVGAPGPAASKVAERAPATPAATDWTEVLTALDVTRADAFARPGSVAISSFDATGSEALRYDAAAVTSLKAQGAHAKGLRLLLVSVAQKSRSADQVTLLVTDRRSSYEVLGTKQQLLSRVAARAPAQHLIILKPVDALHWRIAEVHEVS